MKLVGIAARLIPLAAGAGFTWANIHSWIGIVTAVGTALYTVIITVEAGLRLYERLKLKHSSPRVKGVDA
jgi:hypothetical protein